MSAYVIGTNRYVAYACRCGGGSDGYGGSCWRCGGTGELLVALGPDEMDDADDVAPVEARRSEEPGPHHTEDATRQRGEGGVRGSRSGASAPALRSHASSLTDSE